MLPELNLIHSAELLKLMPGALLGGMFGTQLPKAVRALMDYKCKKRSRVPPENVLQDKTAVFLLAVLDMLLSAAATALMIPSAAAVGICIIQVALVCICVDRYMRIIANETVLLLFGLGLLYRVCTAGFGSLPGSFGALALVAALFGGLAAVMVKVKGDPEVGAGDIKYAMAAAVAVGWQGVIPFLACFAGAVLVYCFLGMKTAMLNRKSYFPMCLHLSVGLLGGLFLPLLGLA